MLPDIDSVPLPGHHRVAILRRMATLRRSEVTSGRANEPPRPLIARRHSYERTPAGTTRGFGVGEFQDIGHMISDVLDGLAAGETGAIERRVQGRVAELCERFPIYR